MVKPGRIAVINRLMLGQGLRLAGSGLVVDSAERSLLFTHHPRGI